MSCCVHCDTELPAGARYCHNCGKAVIDTHVSATLRGKNLCARDDDILIACTPQRGRVVRPNGMLARIVLKKSVVRNGEYGLKPEAVELVELVRKQVAGAHDQE